MWWKGMDFSNPSDVADFLFKRVVFYCTHLSDDRPYGLDCMSRHPPNAFSIFANSFLPPEVAEKLNTLGLGNAREFWNEVEKAYEKLWDMWWPDQLAWILGHIELDLIFLDSIMKKTETNSSKVELLKAYAEILHDFADAIKVALEEQIPLSREQLYEWYKRMYEVASPRGFDKWARIALEYFLRFYNMYKKYELPTLRLLLEYVNETLHKIENEYLPELGALTNQS
jgi:uncharacterized protein YktA (UPF0223 family)